MITTPQMMLKPRATVRPDVAVMSPSETAETPCCTFLQLVKPVRVVAHSWSLAPESSRCKERGREPAAQRLGAVPHHHAQLLEAALSVVVDGSTGTTALRWLGQVGVRRV